MEFNKFTFDKMTEAEAKLSLYSVIQKDGLNIVSLYFKIIFCLYIDSLFAQIGDSNNKCSSSLEAECWNEVETHAVQQSSIQF